MTINDNKAIPENWLLSINIINLKEILLIFLILLLSRLNKVRLQLLYPALCKHVNSQPVAEVLAYLHVQISQISCNVVWSILHVLGKNTDTAIVGYRWMGVGGHHALYY